MDLLQLRAALSAVKIAVAPVAIPGVGTVHVRALTVAEVEDEPQSDVAKDPKGRLARSAMRLLCDAEGNRLQFEDADVELFRAQPWEVLQLMLNAAREHNGLGNLGNG